jgi:hypothetical protein
VFDEAAREYTWVAARGDFDECQVDKSGRWLLVKENVDGAAGEDNIVIGQVILRAGLGKAVKGSGATATIKPDRVSMAVSASVWGLLPMPGLSELRLKAGASAYKERFRPVGSTSQ